VKAKIRKNIENCSCATPSYELTYYSICSERGVIM